MDTSKLKKFAQFARRNLIEQVQSKLRQVLADESAARREHPNAVKDLEQKLNQYSNKKEGEEQLIEQVAYTWFNRFCALRFMDVNQYNRIMVLSPISGQFQPEILAEAKAGHLDDSIFNDKAQEKIQGLLSGSVTSRDGQAEAYRLMIVAVCNDYHRLMPFLFQRIEDYTELLMPDDLLSGNSILAYTREAITPENCESVESIGWLYQFYISEKKDQVFEGLKKNIKITPENIPAATQLFTPHWIVKYLVENSLGRLWMLNNPSSKVIEQMEYYIKPTPAANDEESDFLKVTTPEELKICDPACGSGHMLTYAYDLLYAIYLDANYDTNDIPELILTKNLYGIEIDERASELAAFALSMKAIKGNPNDESNNRRRFFRNPIKPNICCLKKVEIDEDSLEEYMEFIGRDLFTKDLKVTLTEFVEANNVGSLLQPTLTNVSDVLAVIKAKDAQVDFFLSDTHKSVLKILNQADYLSPRYHAVIANPPYMGIKGMNENLKRFAAYNYPHSKNDLYSMFIERVALLSLPNSYVGLITMQSWMYLSRFEMFRHSLLAKYQIASLAHLGSHAFDSIGGEVVQTVAFILRNNLKTITAPFVDLTSVHGEKKKAELFKIIKDDKFLQADNFKKIPGSPITYKMTDSVLELFSDDNVLEKNVFSSSANVTGNNDKYLRYGWEISNTKLTTKEPYYWLPCAKGGEKRKWYGNWEYVINWSDKAHEYYQNTKVCRYVQKEHWNKKGLTWSRIASSENVSFRILPKAATFETAGMTLFPNDEEDLMLILGYLNSNLSSQILQWLNPTLTLQMCDVLSVPYSKTFFDKSKSVIESNVKDAIKISKKDWDSFETSWDFLKSDLLETRSLLLQESYENKVTKWDKLTEQLKSIENENNQLILKLFDLEDDIQNNINGQDITLINNPLYKYKKYNDSDEIATFRKENSIIDFLSYSVGSIFGRYSLDKDGIVLAAQGCSLKDYLNQIPSPSFMPDEDNVIPIIDFELEKGKDEYWFEDDIAERFKAFLKVTFGDENFVENIAFIEEAIGKDIKKYFVKDFYTDHVKRYKKRPIYWMFSSPKGSFNVLIYMHRYQPDTASIVLNDYLREFRTKLEARKESYEQIEISVSASQKDITQAIKAISKIDKVLEEVNDYERDVLYPLAGKNIEIDLDDGVKHNYPLFGKALKKVTGLS